MTESASIQDLVARELALIDDPIRRDALRALLVQPRQEVRSWDYGPPNTRYPCWIVAEAPAQQMGLAYCAQGFGPEMPWGFLPIHNADDDSLGIDAQWDWYLEGAFVRSGLWQGSDRGDEEAFQLSPEERGLR